MRLRRALIAAAACGWAVGASAHAQQPALPLRLGGVPAAAAAPVARADHETGVRQFAAWIASRRDNGRAPYAIVDKRNARLHVYNSTGQLRASTPVLLGLATGDHTVPGLGERELADILPHERTTPAGRFPTEKGSNLQGEDLIWLDYNAGLALHRLHSTSKRERRLERLLSPTPADNRISYGCINVPHGFYDRHVRRVFGQHGVVYVLPDTLTTDAVFPGFQAQFSTGR